MTSKDTADDSRSGIVREDNLSPRPRRRRRSERVVREESLAPGGRERRGRNRQRKSRQPNLMDEWMELQQGVLRAGLEAVAGSLDTSTNVARNMVDRAFAHDYRNPGDVLRNVGKDADATARDVLDGVKDMPRRTHDGFYEVVRPGKHNTARGERWRRAQAEQDDD